MRGRDVKHTLCWSSSTGFRKCDKTFKPFWAVSTQLTCLYDYRISRRYNYQAISRPENENHLLWVLCHRKKENNIFETVSHFLHFERFHFRILWKKNMVFLFANKQKTNSCPQKLRRYCFLRFLFANESYFYCHSEILNQKRNIAITNTSSFC